MFFHIFIITIVLTPISVTSLFNNQNSTIFTNTISVNDYKFERFESITPVINPLELSSKNYQTITNKKTDDQDIKSLLYDRDTRITISNNDDSHPSLDVDYQGNPLAIYYRSMSNDSVICVDLPKNKIPTLYALTSGIVVSICIFGILTYLSLAIVYYQKNRRKE